jgi:hypothetical protein
MMSRLLCRRLLVVGRRDDQNHSVPPSWCSIETWQDYWALLCPRRYRTIETRSFDGGVGALREGMGGMDGVVVEFDCVVGAGC